MRTPILLMLSALLLSAGYKTSTGAEDKTAGFATYSEGFIGVRTQQSSQQALGEVGVTVWPLRNASDFSFVGDGFSDGNGSFYLKIARQLPRMGAGGSTDSVSLDTLSVRVSAYDSRRLRYVDSTGKAIYKYDTVVMVLKPRSFPPDTARVTFVFGG